MAASGLYSLSQIMTAGEWKSSHAPLHYINEDHVDEAAMMDWVLKSMLKESKHADLDYDEEDESEVITGAATCK